MKNKKKIITFIVIALISIGGLVFKGYFTDEIYVLNEEENIDTSENDVLEEDLDKDESSDSKSENSKNISSKEITIYISGEVNNPGIVTLKSDDRLADAVKMLGGVTKKADMNNINLAIKLEDEMHYIIPKKGDKTNNSNQNTNENMNNNQVTNETNSQNNKININTASIQELDAIPGVGEATANKILSYREENGNFKNIEEIKNVNGIGEKKYENMKDSICVN